jgi:hypothetical protein
MIRLSDTERQTHLQEQKKSWTATSRKSITGTTRFSICLHDTFFVGATVTCRETAPGAHEIVAHYGVADAASDDATITTTVPAGEYVWSRKQTPQQQTETQLWKQREADALRVFLLEQHSLRV